MIDTTSISNPALKEDPAFPYRHYETRFSTIVVIVSRATLPSLVARSENFPTRHADQVPRCVLSDFLKYSAFSSAELHVGDVPTDSCGKSITTMSRWLRRTYSTPEAPEKECQTRNWARLINAKTLSPSTGCLLRL